MCVVLPQRSRWGVFPNVARGHPRPLRASAGRGSGQPRGAWPLAGTGAAGAPVGGVRVAPGPGGHVKGHEGQ